MQVLLFENSTSVTEVGSGSLGVFNSSSTRDPPMESGIGSRPLSGRSSYKSAESGSSRPGSSKNNSGEILRPESGKTKAQDKFPGVESASGEGERQELLESTENGKTLIVEGSSATLFEKPSSAKKEEEAETLSKDKGSTDQTDSLLQFETLEAEVAQEDHTRQGSSKVPLEENSKPTSSKVALEEDSRPGSSKAEQKLNSRPGSSKAAQELDIRSGSTNQKTDDSSSSSESLSKSSEKDARPKSSNQKASESLSPPESLSSLSGDQNDVTKESKGGPSRPTSCLPKESESEKSEEAPRSPSANKKDLSPPSSGVGFNESPSSRPASARSLIERYTSVNNETSQPTSMEKPWQKDVADALTNIPNSVDLDTPQLTSSSNKVADSRPTSAKSAVGAGDSVSGSNKSKPTSELGSKEIIEARSSYSNYGNAGSEKDDIGGATDKTPSRPNSVKVGDEKANTAESSVDSDSRPISAKTETKEPKHSNDKDEDSREMSFVSNEPRPSSGKGASADKTGSITSSDKSTDQSSRPMSGRDDLSSVAAASDPEKPERSTDISNSLTSSNPTSTETPEHELSGQSNDLPKGGNENVSSKSAIAEKDEKILSLLSSGDNNDLEQTPSVLDNNQSGPETVNTNEEGSRPSSSKTTDGLDEKTTDQKPTDPPASDNGKGENATEPPSPLSAKNDGTSSRPSSGKEVKTNELGSANSLIKDSRPTSAKESITGSRPSSAKEANQQDLRPMSAKSNTEGSRPTTAKESNTGSAKSESRPVSAKSNRAEDSRPTSGKESIVGSRPSSAIDPSKQELQSLAEDSRPTSAKENVTEDSKSRPTQSKESIAGEASTAKNLEESRPESPKETTDEHSEVRSRPSSTKLSSGSRPQSAVTGAKEPKDEETGDGAGNISGQESSRPSSAQTEAMVKQESKSSVEKVGSDNSSRISSAKSSRSSRPPSAKKAEIDTPTKDQNGDGTESESEKAEESGVNVSRPSSARQTNKTTPMSSSPPLQEKENSQESEDIEILKNNADLSSEDFRRIQELFNLFDEDNSGSMSSAELGKLMRSLGISLHFHLPHPHPHQHAHFFDQVCSQRTWRWKPWWPRWTRIRVARLSCKSLSSTWDCRWAS